MRIGVIGASGYTGGELLRLLMLHKETEVTLATSRQYAGEYVYRIHSNLRGYTDLQFSDYVVDEITSKCDLVFTSLPHGASMNVIPTLANTGLKIIDLSADFRLKDPGDYVKYYGYEHPHQDLLERFTFGIPELRRDEIRGAKLVSCPGCMAVTAILALAPLVKNNLIDTEHIVIDAKIGSSGAGVKPSISTHHAERYSIVRPYKPVGHRHTAEIRQELSRVAGSKVPAFMSPHAVNMVRGILCTSHTFPSRALAVPEVWKAYREFYPEEPFVRFVRDKKGLYRLPDPKILQGSNFCDIGFELEDDGKRLVVMSATDNLMKGASGTAVQNMNIMLGFDERMGLEAPGLHPV